VGRLLLPTGLLLHVQLLLAATAVERGAGSLRRPLPAVWHFLECLQ
jgi:hypothetical protein